MKVQFKRLRGSLQTILEVAALFESADFDDISPEAQEQHEEFVTQLNSLAQGYWNKVAVGRYHGFHITVGHLTELLLRDIIVDRFRQMQSGHISKKFCRSSISELLRNHWPYPLPQNRVAQSWKALDKEAASNPDKSWYQANGGVVEAASRLLIRLSDKTDPSRLEKISAFVGSHRTTGVPVIVDERDDWFDHALRAEMVAAGELRDFPPTELDPKGLVVKRLEARAQGHVARDPDAWRRYALRVLGYSGRQAQQIEAMANRPERARESTVTTSTRDGRVVSLSLRHDRRVESLRRERTKRRTKMKRNPEDE